jgi:hypothetical protein
MQQIRRLLVLALIATPVLAGAQRGRRDRGTKADFDGMISNSSVGLKLSNGDVEDMNPVKLLVDKRKDLKLTDDQQKQIRGMVDALKESNKPNFKALDSLRSAVRPRAGEDESVEQIRTRMAMESVPPVVQTIRDSYAAKLPEALALLDDTQKARANELVAEQEKKAEETLMEKMGAAGRGGRGGRRGGRPPA